MLFLKGRWWIKAPYLGLWIESVLRSVILKRFKIETFQPALSDQLKVVR